MQKIEKHNPGGTEYMVVVETINGVNDWTGEHEGKGFLHKHR